VLGKQLVVDEHAAINFVFRGNSISLAENQPAEVQELKCFFEFNQENFPKLLLKQIKYKP